MKRLITATLYAFLCLPMVAGAASTPISQTPDAGTLTGAEKIPIGRVGGTTAISTTTGALLNRANHTGMQSMSSITNLIASLNDRPTSASVDVIWKGTQAMYDQIVTKDPATLYFITS